MYVIGLNGCVSPHVAFRIKLKLSLRSFSEKNVGYNRNGFQCENRLRVALKTIYCATVVRSATAPKCRQSEHISIIVTGSCLLQFIHIIMLQLYS